MAGKCSTFMYLFLCITSMTIGSLSGRSTKIEVWGQKAWIHTIFLGESKLLTEIKKFEEILRGPVRIAPAQVTLTKVGRGEGVSQTRRRHWWEHQNSLENVSTGSRYVSRTTQSLMSSGVNRAYWHHEWTRGLMAEFLQAIFMAKYGATSTQPASRALMSRRMKR
jgi:hypothetical protein